jgi:hypothetical protein
MQSMCPHCGWLYVPKTERSYALVPSHMAVTRNVGEMSIAALGSGTSEEEVECPGTEQCPRNPNADRRILWNGQHNPHLIG